MVPGGRRGWPDSTGRRVARRHGGRRGADGELTGNSDDGRMTASAGGADSGAGGRSVGGVGGRLTGDGDDGRMTATAGRADNGSVWNM